MKKKNVLKKISVSSVIDVRRTAKKKPVIHFESVFFFARQSLNVKKRVTEN